MIGCFVLLCQSTLFPPPPPTMSVASATQYCRDAPFLPACSSPLGCEDQSSPAFQGCCRCAPHLQVRGAVLEASSRLEEVCSLPLGLRCCCIGTGKLERIGPFSYFMYRTKRKPYQATEAAALQPTPFANTVPLANSVS